MNISIHVQNNDSTSSNALLSNFLNCRIILCSGHIAQNHENHFKSQIKIFQKT
uniref:Uncharacterized protein n=1 Tax=Amphimedon queenslandica TaxID=400682 RepID=A0A1X7VG64_AMPQE